MSVRSIVVFRRSLLLVILLVIAAFPAAAAKRAVNGKIAFVSDRDGNREIYVMNPDGSGQTRLTNDPVGDSDPAWSPNGKRIAFEKDGQIFVMNGDGSDATQLTNRATNLNPAWSPDGTKIAFQSSRDSVEFLNFEIYIMGADGSDQTRLTVFHRQDFQPAFSPDGRTIAFMCEGRALPEIEAICLMNVDGTNVREVSRTEDIAFDSDPSFSPDGRKILFSRGPEANFRDHVWIMNADGTNQEKLALGTYSPNLFNVGSHPVFSPDGAQIAYGFDQYVSFETRIELMKPDGSDQTVIAQTRGASNSQPSWQRLPTLDTIGVYLPSGGQWLLRNSNSAGDPDIVVTFGGKDGDLPVAGDWNGDGRTDIAVYRDGTFVRALLKQNDLCIPCQQFTVAEPFDSFAFGEPGDLPVAGDWNGDAVDDVGVFRSGPQGTFLLRVPQLICPFCIPPHTQIATQTIFFGTSGFPVAGDWDGDGKDGIGLFEPVEARFFLSDDLAKPNFTFVFGQPNDLPLAGDWEGRGHDGIGVFHPDTRTMFLSSTITFPPDNIFDFGESEGLPVAGHWTPLQ